MRILTDDKEIYLLNPINGIVEKSTVNKLVEYFNVNYDRIAQNYKTGYYIKSLGLYSFKTKPSAKTIRTLMRKHIYNDEIYKQIDNTDYYINQYSRIKIIKENGKDFYLIQHLKSRSTGKSKCNPVPSINLRINGVYKLFRVSRLVAEYFVLNDDPVNKKCVIHKDGNIKNNEFVNLKWATNAQAAVISNKMPGQGKTSPISVLKICPDSLEIIDEYSSCSEAAKNNYISYKAIANAVKGKTRNNMSCGYIWKVDEDFCKRNVL